MFVYIKTEVPQDIVEVGGEGCTGEEMGQAEECGCAPPRSLPEFQQVEKTDF